MRSEVRRDEVLGCTCQVARDVLQFFYNKLNMSSLSRSYQKILHCSNECGRCMGMLGWLYLAIIWNWRCTPIPAIFVSYPYRKFKRFGKEHTTICSGPLFFSRNKIRRIR